MSRTKLLSILAFGSLLAASQVPARADIITTKLAGNPSTGDGFFAFTYNVTLTGGQLTGTTTDQTGSPTPFQFGTVYDFGPLARNGADQVYIGLTGYLGTSFYFTFNNTDTAASQTLPNDDPNLTNIRFVYNGLDTLSAPVGGDNIDLGNFTVYSPYSQVANNIQYDGQSYKTTNNTIQGNVGFTAGPFNNVPEPASLLLLGAGLAAAGLARRRAN